MIFLKINSENGDSVKVGMQSDDDPLKFFE